jgi:hypothetical protein
LFSSAQSGFLARIAKLVLARLSTVMTETVRADATMIKVERHRMTDAGLANG